ncbi:MAG: hypothetical protein GX387_12600 [Clostridium sp.]|jgi:hypothetical protein|nr:hypothetical protein [Clostridium sp.]
MKRNSVVSIILVVLLMIFFCSDALNTGIVSAQNNLGKSPMHSSDIHYENSECDHEYGPWEIIKEPTCTEKGIRESICTRCSVKITEEIPERMHIILGDMRSPTCTEEGLVEEYCELCRKIFSTVVIPPKGHTFSHITIEPNQVTLGTDNATESPICVNAICSECEESIEVTSEAEFSSSNNNIASVVDGYIKSGTQSGTATITADYDGMKAICSVEVKVDDDEDEETTISGYISVDFNYPAASEGKIKSGFIVKIDGTEISTTTDEKGYFEITDIPEDMKEFTLEISKPGYLKRNITVNGAGGLVVSTEDDPLILWAGDVECDGAQDGAINMGVPSKAWQFQLVKI